MILNMYSAWHRSPSICTAMVTLVTTTIKMVLMMMMVVRMMMMMTVQSLVTGPSRDHPEHVLRLAPLSSHLDSNGDTGGGDDDDDDDDDDDALLASIIPLLLTLAQTSVQPQKPPFLMTAPLQSRRG